MKFYTRRAPLVTARQQKGRSPSEERDQPVAHRAGGGPSAEIARPVPPFAEQPGDGAVDRVRRPALAHVAEEQDAREDRRERVRQVLPGDVGGGPVHRLEDGGAYAQVRTRHDAEPAHQTGAQVGDDVAVEVLEEQHVERLRAADELQAGVVDDQLLVADAGWRFATCRAQARKRPSESFMMFALWMATTFRRWSRRASSKARRAMRREARAVITLTRSTTPGAIVCSMPE